MTKEIWGDVREILRGTLGANSYSNWIEPLEFSKLGDGVAIFHVPTNFIGNYVAQNFGDQILYQLNRA
ncbi:MAG: DnaA N-terminal domain-containing protein, partial [Marivivens sp.]